MYLIKQSLSKMPMSYHYVFLKYFEPNSLFRIAPFEIDLYHTDLFRKYKICHTSPDSVNVVYAMVLLPISLDSYKGVWLKSHFRETPSYNGENVFT